VSKLARKKIKSRKPKANNRQPVRGPDALSGIIKLKEFDKTRKDLKKDENKN